jgi:twitching motility protein PilT
MAKLDKLLESVGEIGASQIYLASDAEPSMRLPSGWRKVGSWRPDLAALEGLIAELLPEDVRAGLASEPSLSFSYRLSPSAAFQAHVLRAPQRLHVLFVPRRSADGPPGPAIDALLRRARADEASDLHLSTGEPPALRVHGDLKPLDGPPLSAEAARAMILEVMPEARRAEFLSHWDVDFAYEIPDGGRFRVNAFMERRGPGAAFRLVPSELLSLDALGLPRDFRALCQLRQGLILVTGPTGSGKTTTLNALVQEMNQARRDHILTIEDPIEYLHTSDRCIIHQREVGRDAASFGRAVRSALREDPDVILIGEMRDPETTALALQAAETGHLVLSTLHTSTAASTIERIVDQFPDAKQGQIRAMLADTLRAVLAQTLCRRIGGGRVAAMEVLICTPAAANLIREQKTYQLVSVMQAGRRQGMVTMTQALCDLVKGGKIEPREAYARAPDRGAIAAMLTKDGSPGFAEAPAA